MIKAHELRRVLKKVADDTEIMIFNDADKANLFTIKGVSKEFREGKMLIALHKGETELQREGKTVS